MKDSRDYILCKLSKKSIPKKVFLYPHLRINRISRTFKDSRLRHNLSQKEMSRKLAISENYLWMIEIGQRFPSLKLSITLAEVTEMNPYWVKSIWINEAVARSQLKIELKGEKYE